MDFLSGLVKYSPRLITQGSARAFCDAALTFLLGQARNAGQQKTDPSVPPPTLEAIIASSVKIPEWRAPRPLTEDQILAAEAALEREWRRLHGGPTLGETMCLRKKRK